MFVSPSYIPSGSTYRAPWYYDYGRDIDAPATQSGCAGVLGGELGSASRLVDGRLRSLLESAAKCSLVLSTGRASAVLKPAPGLVR